MVKIRTLKQFYEGSYFDKWLRLSYPELNNYHRAETNFLLGHIKDETILLDVGCGTGRSLEPIVKRVSKAYGIDFSELMLKEVENSLGKKVELRHANAENLPYPDSMFDYVICMCNTYGNFENPDECLDEMLRVVKPKGEVMLSVYSQDALTTQLETYRQVGLNIKNFDDKAVYTNEGLISRRFSRNDLENIAKKHNVKIEVKELTTISYLAIFSMSR